MKNIIIAVFAICLVSCATPEKEEYPKPNTECGILADVVDAEGYDFIAVKIRNNYFVRYIVEDANQYKDKIGTEICGLEHLSIKS